MQGGLGPGRGGRRRWETSKQRSATQCGLGKDLIVHLDAFTPFIARRKGTDGEAREGVLLKSSTSVLKLSMYFSLRTVRVIPSVLPDNLLESRLLSSCRSNNVVGIATVKRGGVLPGK